MSRNSLMYPRFRVREGTRFGESSVMASGPKNYIIELHELMQSTSDTGLPPRVESDSASRRSRSRLVGQKQRALNTDKRVEPINPTNTETQAVLSDGYVRKYWIKKLSQIKQKLFDKMSFTIKWLLDYIAQRISQKFEDRKRIQNRPYFWNCQTFGWKLPLGFILPIEVFMAQSHGISALRLFILASRIFLGDKPFIKH